VTHHNEFWRLLRENAEAAVRKSGEPPVRLRGGPANDWLVTDDAPMLRDDWHTTWPEFLTAEYRRGRYVLAEEMEPDARVARWEELEA
jgi:hypothetical protein